MWYYNTLYGVILLIIVCIGAAFDIIYLIVSRTDSKTEDMEIGKEISNYVMDDDEKELKPLKNYKGSGHLAPIVQIDEKINNEMHVLFVYGTLKRGFHWNHKYLSRGGKFIARAKTVDKYPLIMGDCCVPYVIDYDNDDNKDEIGEYILGELWHIDYETLSGLDEYEGVTKGHYKRKTINVVILIDDDDDGKIIEADLYMKADVDNIDFSNEELMNEYSLQFHKKYYSPIKHIQVKQLKYLSEDFSRT